MARKLCSNRLIACSFFIILFFGSFSLTFFGAQAGLEGNFQQSLEETGKAATFIPEVGEKAKVTETKIEQIVGTVVGFLLGFISVIFFVIIFVAGFMWMMADGNEEKIGKAKKLIMSSMFALYILTAAYLLTLLLTKLLITDIGFNYGYQ